MTGPTLADVEAAVASLGAYRPTVIGFACTADTYDALRDALAMREGDTSASLPTVDRLPTWGVPIVICESPDDAPDRYTWIEHRPNVDVIQIWQRWMLGGGL